MPRRRGLVLLLVLAAPAVPTGTAAHAVDDRAANEFFEKEVRPVLAQRCFECHAEKAKGGLRLDSRDSILVGGDSGPAVAPGAVEESLLVQAIRYDDPVLKMPPKGRLTEAEIAALEKWVALGAPWPAEPARTEASGAGASGPDLVRRRAGHWSFRPIASQAPPDVRDAAWPSNPIDGFVLARLEAAGLSPAPEADRRTLIRRLTFDLHGLPPTPEEIEAFVADDRPDAYERLVDRLLASPRYGERWTRHWLDLVRYAETAGHEFDYDIPFAWRYRDYVVRAFNADVPYDAFVIEHLAGDLLPEPRLDPSSGRNESIVGTAAFLLGEGTHSPVDVREEQVRRIDNQIDVLGKAFLGLTVACARCHDHKFDPITQRDYYALVGFLKSARHQYAFLDPPGPLRELAAALRAEARALAAAADDPPQAVAPRSLSVFPSPLVGEGRERGTDEPSAPLTDTPTVADVFETFDAPAFNGWFAAGQAFGDGPSQASDARVLDGGSIQKVPPGVAHSGLASDRLEGVLRSRTFTIEHNYIHYLAAGRRGRVHCIVDGFEKVREPIYGALALAVDHGDGYRWVTQDVRMWRGQRAYIELADGGVADFSGPRTVMAPGDGYLAVAEIRFSDGPAPPVPPGWDEPPKPAPIGAGRLVRFHALESRIEPPTLAPALADGTGEDEHVLLRGNYRTPGEPVPRRFLEVFGEEATPDAGSGRLDLVRRVVDPANPLPARVLVNRLWHHHFGRGLVATPDDFGHMGEPPTHPELLDWLAAEFVRSGWSVKHLHRLMVGSRTYRMTSLPDAGADRADPGNRLWHRREARRLEAEALRDAILSISGALRNDLYGPGVPPYLTPHMDGRGRPEVSGPLDGDGRRSLYLSPRRNFLSPLLLAFDLPTPTAPMGRRNVSNVPAQALALLNDPFVVEQARRWAGRVLDEPPSDAAGRVDRMYRTAFGRSPAADERAAALDFLGGRDDPDAWTDLAHALLNVKELYFLP
jgi:hypothetical protein